MVIIDDGSHLADHVILTFRTLFKHLQPGGFYIVEDVHFHAGSGAAYWRGFSETPPQDILLRLARLVSCPETDGDAERDWAHQVDFVEFFHGGVAIRKRRSPSLADVEARRTLVKQANDPTTWSRFGEYVWNNTHDLADAVQCVQRAIDLEPRASGHEAMLSSILQAADDLAGAAEAAERAARLNPGDERLRVRAARLRALAGEAGLANESDRLFEQRISGSRTGDPRSHAESQHDAGAAEKSVPSHADPHAWFRRFGIFTNQRQFADLDREWSRLPTPLQTDHGIMSLWCQVPRLVGNWQETMLRAAEMAKHWPDSTQPLVCRMHAINGLEGYLKAKPYIQNCVSQHEQEPEILNAAAEIAMAAEDFEDVIEKCQLIRQVGDRHFGAGHWHASAVANRALGRAENATVEVVNGLLAYPEDPLLKADANAWGIPEPERAPAYELPTLTNPRSSFVEMRGYAAIEAEVGLCPKDLVTNFDTLGENCEFGFIQREVGAEPLSLMRFAGMRWEEMAFALNAGFDRIDSPGNLMPKVADGCWDIRDRRYNIAYHTFLPIETMPEERLLFSQARRLRWLADKLVSDLKSGEKFFLAWRSRAEDPSDIMPLLRAVRRHGDATIIVVEAGDGNPGVEELAPGLLRGRVGWVRSEAGARDHEGWLAMLGNAWLLLRRRQHDNPLIGLVA